jgi:hypothetical protein
MQAPSALTQAELEATELALLMESHKIIRLTFSTWSTKGKLQMEAKITTNK